MFLYLFFYVYLYVCVCVCVCTHAHLCVSVCVMGSTIHAVPTEESIKAPGTGVTGMSCLLCVLGTEPRFSVTAVNA
jgi:hypothetical protein